MNFIYHHSFDASQFKQEVIIFPCQVNNTKHSMIDDMTILILILIILACIRRLGC